MSDPLADIRKHRPMTADPKRIAEWLVETCLTFGSTVGTAYKVAGLFVEAIGIEPPPRQAVRKPDGRRRD